MAKYVQECSDGGRRRALGGAKAAAVDGAPEERPGYVFEQFRVERSCLGYVVADRETRRAAIVDPEAELVEPMLDFVFEQGLKPFYVIDTHTHADHFSGARSRSPRRWLRS